MSADVEWEVTLSSNAKFRLLIHKVGLFRHLFFTRPLSSLRLPSNFTLCPLICSFPYNHVSQYLNHYPYLLPSDSLPFPPPLTLHFYFLLTSAALHSPLYSTSLLSILHLSLPPNIHICSSSPPFPLSPPSGCPPTRAALHLPFPSHSLLIYTSFPLPYPVPFPSILSPYPFPFHNLSSSS